MINLADYSCSNYNRGISRWKEVGWWIVRSLLFAPWFPTPSPLKVFALRCFGAKVGKGVVIRSRVNVTMPWRLEVGDNVWFGDEVMILSLAQVTIGSNVCISQRAFLCTGSHDFTSDSFSLITKPIQIEDSSWISARAFVGPGATIPKGTMIKAGKYWSG